MSKLISRESSINKFYFLEPVTFSFEGKALYGVVTGGDLVSAFYATGKLKVRVGLEVYLVDSNDPADNLRHGHVE